MNTRIALGFLVAGVLMLVALFLARSHAVIFSYRESGNPTGDASWTILNPFRDRAPEQTSELLLKSLQSGSNPDPFGKLSRVTPTYASYLAKMEAEYPITAWKLISREDPEVAVRPAYRIARGTSSELDSRVWITVQFRQGKWEVIDFDAWY